MNSAATAAPAIPAPSTDEPLVPVFNKSPKGGDYIHLVFEEVKDGQGRVVGRKLVREWRAQAGVFSKIPEWLARLWKRQAPEMIVDADAVGAPDDHRPRHEEVVKLEQQHADDERRIENLERMVAELKASRGR